MYKKLPLFQTIRRSAVMVCGIIAAAALLRYIVEIQEINLVKEAQAYQIERSLETGAQNIILPRVSSANRLAYGGIPDTGDWNKSYKNFHGIPQEIKVTFSQIPLEEWEQKYRLLEE